MEKIGLMVLFGQRINSYPNEYAPEALAVMDEYGNDDNPLYLKDEVEKYRQLNEFSSLRIFEIEIDYSQIRHGLNESPKIIGKIVNEVEGRDFPK